MAVDAHPCPWLHSSLVSAFGFPGSEVSSHPQLSAARRGNVLFLRHRDVLLAQSQQEVSSVLFLRWRRLELSRALGPAADVRETAGLD